jgi:hypothetical protein
VTAADEFARARKDGCTNGDAAFGTALARFVESNRKHVFVNCMVHRGDPLVTA